MVNPRTKIPIFLGQFFSVGFLVAGLALIPVPLEFGPKTGLLLMALGFSLLWAWSSESNSFYNRCLQVGLLLAMAELGLLLSPLGTGNTLILIFGLGALSLGYFYGFPIWALYGLALVAVAVSVLGPEWLGSHPWETGIAFLTLVIALHVAQFLFQARLAKVQKEKGVSETLVRLGSTLNANIHDWEGRLALQQNLLTLLSSELKRVRSSSESWDRVDKTLDLLLRTTQESRVWGQTLRRRVLDGNVESSEGTSLSLREFCLEVAGAYNNLTYDAPSHGDLRLQARCSRPLRVILDNVFRNALEAGANTVVVTWQTHKQTIWLEVTNDGRPILGCTDCHCRPCDPPSCGRFSLGHSEKADGTGTGMVAVLESLKLVSGSFSVKANRTQTRFIFCLPDLLVKPSVGPII